MHLDVPELQLGEEKSLSRVSEIALRVAEMPLIQEEFKLRDSEMHLGEAKWQLRAAE